MSYRSPQVNSVEILGGEAWLRAFINIATFIKGVISSLKFWCVSGLRASGLTGVLPVSCTCFPFFSPLLFLPLSLAVPQKCWGHLETHSLHCECPSLFWPSPISAYPHIHLSTSFCLLCYDLPFLPTVSFSVQSCPKQVLMWTFPPPSKFLPSMSSFMSHLILCLKGFVSVEALSTFRYAGR